MKRESPLGLTSRNILVASPNLVADDQVLKSRRPFQFHLWHALGFITLACVLLAVLRVLPREFIQEGGGFFIACLFAGLFVWVLAAPGYILTYRWTKSRGWSFVAGLATSLSVIYFVLLPGFTTPRWAARRMQCGYNLKQIGIALHTYHDEYKSLPPAYVCDESGKRMHSWRVLLLPYMEQQELYKQYDLDEPWDAPNNIKLAPAITAVYQCPEETHMSASGASYLAVVGKRTMWPGQKSITLNDVKDGTSNSIMIVEVANSGIQGSEPRDLDYSQLAFQINPPQGGGISSLHGKTWRSDPNCVEALFGDGSVHLLQNDLKPATLKLLLEINDGQPIGDY